MQRFGIVEEAAQAARGLTDAVADMTGHWPSSAIHFERFGADTSRFAPNAAFSVRLQRSGTSVPVALMLDTMHFAEEIRDVEDLNLPSEHAKVEARHIKIAEQLVDSLAGPFKPEKYHDRYREALEKLIEKKLKGTSVKSSIKKRQATNVVDIMDRLNASLKGTKKKTTTKRATTTKKRTTAKAKKSAKKRAA